MRLQYFEMRRCDKIVRSHASTGSAAKELNERSLALTEY